MKKILFITLFSLACTWLSAQKITYSTIVSSGDVYKAANGTTLSWSLGELVTDTYKNNTHVLTQGFQQYFLKLVPTKEVVDIKVRIYPNPTASSINLEVENKVAASYILQNMNGQILEKGSINAKNTNIDLQNMPVATYILTVNDINNNVLSSYKVLKLN